MRHKSMPLLVTMTCLAAMLITYRTTAETSLQPNADIIGDGSTDSTQAIQAALNAMAGSGGGVVLLPSGTYRINGNLVIPRDVTLEGVWRAPQRGGEPTLPGTSPGQSPGTLLLAFAGKNNPDAPPFITLRDGSTVKGITIYYPEQQKTNPPVPYPWTIATTEPTTGCSILDVTIINPYQAVDFGTQPTGRHYVRGLYGDALHRGLYINQCYDVGRVEDVHFWPFFDLDPESPLWVYKREHAIAYILGRTDGEMMSRCFSFGYSVGMHFIAGPINGLPGEPPMSFESGAGMFSQCYMDVTPCAIRIEEVMPTAGVSFVNCSLMSGVEVSARNKGPVKFASCGFWAVPGLKSHASLEGRGAIIFESCHFSRWDQSSEGHPCINANNQRLIVTACDFDTARQDHIKITLGPMVRAAAITSNLMPGGVLIKNQASSHADIQIALNASEPLPGFLREWLVLGPFPNPTGSTHSPGRPSRLGYEIDYLASLGGEPQARLADGATVTHKGQSFSTQKARADESGRVNLKNIFGQGKGVAYAFCYLISPTEQQATLDFGANDCSKIWLNSELIHAFWQEKGDAPQPGSHRATVKLRQGANPLLVKVEDAGGRLWEFVMEAYDCQGEPMKAVTAEELP